MDFFYYISRFIIELILKFGFGIKFKVSGQEFIPKKGACLVISNHLSYLDPLVIGLNCRRILTFMARQDLFDNWFLGAWMKTVGVLAIKRDSADLKSIRNALRVLARGRALAIFPEGSRQEDPNASFRQIKRGFLFLAKNSGAPIVAAKIHGSEKALPKHAKKINPGVEIEVVFSQPFRISKDEDYALALERLEAVLGKM